ncbi:LysR family transcriptional regulator ArgP [Leucobacter ruminantium]|uniref:LysR family transcriptional regulator ArgP n=1 Tax=Leucobacter ruminantium TaxID=1289170 RepID=A0A939LXI6_9MICO|nr:LysR family transcriptional regulator ArgP [Leucobacter ruminantium]MBO1804978.1 LysR family transcriptional regulator ArgP [Leucobacter ruminantium]
MDLPVEHLGTFAAIVDEGSFEGAARHLHITPSAVSQRVRAMEQRVGTVLLRRTRPVEVTEAGSAVLRAARQLARIADDVAAELGGGQSGSLVPLVVNADSLATWVVPALARAARETGARFEVLRADETVSTARLRNGEAMAALTATAAAVPGCTSTLLGVDRYHAVAAPDFAAEHFAAGITADTLGAAPMMEFDRQDMFQQRFISSVTRARIDPPRHYVPSSAEFATAIELGMGWGMLPERQCAEGIAAGRFTDLRPGAPVELPLYWQRWNLRSPVLDALSAIIADEAAAVLDPTPARRLQGQPGRGR